MGVETNVDFGMRIADFFHSQNLKSSERYSTRPVFNDQNPGCRVSGVSAAAGR
jgi:hypothetical protein